MDDLIVIKQLRLENGNKRPVANSTRNETKASLYIHLFESKLNKRIKMDTITEYPMQTGDPEPDKSITETSRTTTSQHKTNERELPCQS